jgi:hypothetical protein
VPTFDFIASDELRITLERDSEELVACMKAGAWKSAHAMASSLIQATLVEYLASSGRAAGQQLIATSFARLLDICRDEQVLTPRTVELATFIRPYTDFLSPDGPTRLKAATDETGARIAQALLEIVINEVSAHKKDVYRHTAEQIVAKLQSDPSSVSIVGHLLRKISRAELERLLSDLIPQAYYEAARASEPPAGETLAILAQCFRQAFDLAPVDLKTVVARRFLYVLENESEYIVNCYEGAFFRGSDLAFLDEEARGVVKAHFFSSLSKQVTLHLVNASSGIGEFLETEGDARAFFVPLVLSLTDVKNEALAAATIKRAREEFSLLTSSSRKSIGSWIGRLSWSFAKEGRQPVRSAIERLESELAALPS